jgi:hypothetical protein
MTAYSKPTKKTVAAKTVKWAATNPRRARTVARASVPVVKFGAGIGKRVVKRRARQQVKQSRRAARERVEYALLVTQTTAELVTIYGPIVALALGFADPPPRRSKVPQLAAGIAVGAGAAYFLGSKRGPDRIAR